MAAADPARRELLKALGEAFDHPHAVDVDALADRVLRVIEQVVARHAQGPQHTVQTGAK